MATVKFCDHPVMKTCQFCDHWLPSVDVSGWGWCRWVDEHKKMPPGFLGHATESDGNSGLETTSGSRCNVYTQVQVKKYDTEAR